MANPPKFNKKCPYINSIGHKGINCKICFPGNLQQSNNPSDRIRKIMEDASKTSRYKTGYPISSGSQTWQNKIETKINAIIRYLDEVSKEGER